MKNILLIAAITISSLATAQMENITFGAKAGLNIASVTGDIGENSDSRISFHLGAVARYDIDDKLSIQPELLYSSQGASGEIENTDFTIKLDYINLPVLATYEVYDNLRVLAGPEIGINISAKSETGDFEGDIEDVNTLALGLALGAQYQLEQGIFFQARYAAGLSKIVEDVDGSNSVISLSVGYFFN